MKEKREKVKSRRPWSKSENRNANRKWTTLEKRSQQRCQKTRRGITEFTRSVTDANADMRKDKNNRVTSEEPNGNGRENVVRTKWTHSSEDGFKSMWREERRIIKLDTKWTLDENWITELEIDQKEMRKKRCEKSNNFRKSEAKTNKTHGLGKYSKNQVSTTCKPSECDAKRGEQ